MPCAGVGLHVHLLATMVLSMLPMSISGTPRIATEILVIIVAAVELVPASCPRVLLGVQLPATATPASSPRVILPAAHALVGPVACARVARATAHLVVPIVIVVPIVVVPIVAVVPQGRGRGCLRSLRTHGSLVREGGRSAEDGDQGANGGRLEHPAASRRQNLRRIVLSRACLLGQEGHLVNEHILLLNWLGLHSHGHGCEV